MFLQLIIFPTTVILDITVPKERFPDYCACTYVDDLVFKEFVFPDIIFENTFVNAVYFTYYNKIWHLMSRGEFFPSLLHAYYRILILNILPVDFSTHSVVIFQLHISIYSFSPQSFRNRSRVWSDFSLYINPHNIIVRVNDVLLNLCRISCTSIVHDSIHLFNDMSLLCYTPFFFGIPICHDSSGHITLILLLLVNDKPYRRVYYDHKTSVNRLLKNIVFNIIHFILFQENYF